MIERPWRKTGRIINCKLCGKEKYYPLNKFKNNRGKYCCKSCCDKDYIGVHRNPKNEIKKGQRIGVLTEFKKGMTSGNKNINWSGNNVGYFALHGWVSRHLKKIKCNKCGTNKNLEYSNISFKYKRNINDWKVLCSKCHDNYDRNKNWGIATKKFNL